MPRLKQSVYFFMVVGLVTGGLSLLIAANGTSPVSNTTQTTSESDLKPGNFICLGFIDTYEAKVTVFPTSPQPCRIIHVLKKEGDVIKAGESIAELDLQIAKFNLQEAKSLLDQAIAMEKKAKDGLEAHKVLIEVQEDALEAKQRELESNETKLEYLKRRADQGFPGAQTEYDAAKKAVEGLRKAVDAEMKKLHGLKEIRPSSALDQAHAARDQANVGVAKAQYALDQLKYVSPIHGIVINSSLYDGMMFTPGLRTDAITIQPTGKLIVRAEVLQEYASRVSLNQKAVIIDHMNSQLSWTGKVVKIAETFQPKRSSANGFQLFANNEDPVLEVLIELENQTQKDLPSIRIGQRVRVTMGGK